MIMKRSRLLIAIVISLVFGGLLFYFYGGSVTPAGQHPLVSLSAGNFDGLRNDFNTARGTVRVIALLSPT
jgi:hypothetical protein